MKKVSILFTLIAIIILLYYPSISNAAVNLPWSTTFNCPDWTQSMGLYNVNCDGLRGDGAWTTSDGKEEQITSAANYSGGGGGKGQRHWMGDGVNNVSGGLGISFTSSQSELWIRWYMRYENGFQWNPLNNQKILYINVLGQNAVVVQYVWSDQVRIASRDYSGYYESPQGNGWQTIMGGNASDGGWHLYEVHIKTDTNGNNGIAEMWIDGVQRISVSNANFGSLGFDYILIGSNGFEPNNGRTMYIDFDDIMIDGIAVSSGSGGDTSSSGDTSNSGGGCGFVKDISSKPNSPTVQIILNFLLIFLPFIFIKILQLKKAKNGLVY